MAGTFDLSLGLVVIESVTAVQDPAMAGVDSDARVSHRVARHRNERDPVVNLRQWGNVRKPLPSSSSRMVFDDGSSIGWQLRVAITQPRP